MANEANVYVCSVMAVFGIEVSSYREWWAVKENLLRIRDRSKRSRM